MALRTHGLLRLFHWIMALFCAHLVSYLISFTGKREIMIPLPKNIFSEGDVYTCTWSTKTTQTSGKPVVMKLGSVRYLEITTNHDVQSPFLHSWECELGMGAAAHCCSNLEIRAGEDWHFLLCYVSSHVFSSNQKQNRVISLIFAQIKPSLVSLTSSIAKL